MKIKSIFLFVYAIFLFSCSGGKGGGTTAAQDGMRYSNLYAEGFEITGYKDFTTIEIADPWDTTKILQKYILVKKGIPLPDNLPHGTVVRTPVENVIIYTTIHASIWEELHALENVVGICEPEYLTSKKALELLHNGSIHDCGKASSPNVEKIMDIGGEVIIASPFEHGGYGQAEKLGIPIIESADYMETHPLGRVEWLKVFGLLSGREKEADSLFNATVSRYNGLKEIASKAVVRPRLMTERKYGSSWFIAGGASYMAVMYEDAGADYIFRDNPDTGSVPYAFENVFEAASDADLWLLKYGMEGSMTYNDLRSEYKPYEDFAPFRNGKIYTCNTVDTPYYEYIAIHPDYILADFLHIFHPELLPEHELICYKPMEGKPRQ